jgi:2-iminobutanoate/2-iminopropanoate deaminase
MSEFAVISTAGAPAAVGPYAQGTRHGPYVWTAGQIGLDPATGELVPGGVAAETRRTLANLAAILEAGGSDLTHVVKTTVFLVDMADFTAMNAAYAECFPGAPPARATVSVAALPRGARVEIDAVGVLASP